MRKKRDFPVALFWNSRQVIYSMYCGQDFEAKLGTQEIIVNNSAILEIDRKRLLQRYDFRFSNICERH